MRRVGCSEAARQAARFTAVVVFPTPPFWFATAIIRANKSSRSENLAKCRVGCKMFHVEHWTGGGKVGSSDEEGALREGVPRGTLETMWVIGMFHVKQKGELGV
jgi:hypothetical protein